MGTPKLAAARRVGTLVDHDTGQRFHISEERGPSRSYGKRFHIVFDEAWRDLVSIRNASTLRVFMALPDHLSWTEFRPLPREQLAKLLEIDGASVSRALTDLHNRGMIERRGKGPVTQWKLSLNWGWKGNAAAYHAAMRDNDAHRIAAGKSPRPGHLIAAEDILWKLAGGRGSDYAARPQSGKSSLCASCKRPPPSVERGRSHAHSCRLLRCRRDIDR